MDKLNEELGVKGRFEFYVDGNLCHFKVSMVVPVYTRYFPGCRNYMAMNANFSVLAYDPATFMMMSIDGTVTQNMGHLYYPRMGHLRDGAPGSYKRSEDSVIGAPFGTGVHREGTWGDTLEE